MNGPGSRTPTWMGLPSQQVGVLLFQALTRTTRSYTIGGAQAVSRSSGQIRRPGTVRGNARTADAGGRCQRMGGYRGEKEARPDRASIRKEALTMKCGNCKGEHDTAAEVRACHQQKQESEKSSLKPGQPIIDPDEGTCSTPGCHRHVSRDAAGEYQPLCSWCFAAGVKPDPPNARRDIPNVPETVALLKEYRLRRDGTRPPPRQLAEARAAIARQDLTPLPLSTQVRIGRPLMEAFTTDGYDNHLPIDGSDALTGASGTVISGRVGYEVGDFFQWVHVDGLWPRRLIHRAHLESHE